VPTPSALLRSQQTSLENAYNAAETELTEMEGSMRPTDVYELISVTEAELQAPSKLQVLADPKFRVGLGFQLGLLAAALIVLIAERMNPRIDDPTQAEAIVGAPVLAMVPVLGRRRRSQIQRVDPEEFKGPYAEAFRTMRAHLDFRAAAAELDKPPRIMVTSATPSEGKSTTAAFLALSFAESDRSPVVIGGDLRRPSIHRLFGVDRMPGLTTRSLPGGRNVPLTDIVRRDPVSGVTLVPSGPSVDNVNDVMRDLVAVSEVAHNAGQVVILDTAPIRVANDAIDFLVAVDWVVVVVQAGKSTTRSVTQMMHTLRMNGAEVVGVVMLGSVESSDASRDYYSYYAPEEKSRRERRREERAADRSTGPEPVLEQPEVAAAS
jgi:capsular exopolysaccharide synthesis family protein